MESTGTCEIISLVFGLTRMCFEVETARTTRCAAEMMEKKMLFVSTVISQRNKRTLVQLLHQNATCPCDSRLPH